MVPVTYLFVVLFGEGTWANEFAFAAWHRSAYSTRSTIELEGSAWAFRYVLLCCLRESAAKFTMNVSIKTSRFRSKTPTESSCRQTRPDRSSSASCGCVHVHVPAYRWVNFGSLRKRATANHLTRTSCHSWSSKGNTSTTVWQKIRSVPPFLQPPAIDKEPESNAKMYVNQRRDEMARTWKHILRHEHFRAKYRYVGVFFERRFQPLSFGGFFPNQRESTSRCPKSPFPSKTQNRQIARTSPLRRPAILL